MFQITAGVVPVVSDHSQSCDWFQIAAGVVRARDEAGG